MRRVVCVCGRGFGAPVRGGEGPGSRPEASTHVCLPGNRAGRQWAGACQREAQSLGRGAPCRRRADQVWWAPEAGPRVRGAAPLSVSRTRAEPAQGGSARRGRSRAVRARGVRGDAAVGFPEAAGRGRRAHPDGWRRLRADGGGGGGRGRGVEQPPRDRTEPRRRTCRSARGAARARPPPGAAAEAAEATGCGRVRQDERRGERGGPCPTPAPLSGPRPCSRLAAPARGPRRVALPGRPAPTPAPGRVFLPRPGGVRGAGTLRASAGVRVRAEVRGPASQVRGSGFGLRGRGLGSGVQPPGPGPGVRGPRLPSE